MSTPSLSLPLLGAQAGFRRFSVGEYHRLIEIGMLTENDKLELLEGYLVHKMSRNPPHDAVLQLIDEVLAAILPAGWRTRIQSAVTLSNSEPEPDVAVVRGDARTYTKRHPQAADIGLVIEVSESTLDGDRLDKGRIYSRAGILCYWIVNLVDRRLEVYTNPVGSTEDATYASSAIYGPRESAPLILDGTQVATIAITDILP